MNEYLSSVLGVNTKIQDSAYVVYNLFQRHNREKNVPANAQPSAIGKVLAKRKQTMETMTPFVGKVLEMERLPLQSKDREIIKRSLEAHYIKHLPDCAGDLLRTLKSLASSCLTIFEEPLPVVQPPRTARIAAHRLSQDRLSDLHEGRSTLEGILNEINFLDDYDHADFDDAAESELIELEAARDELYAACDELYNSHVAPRIAAAEILLYTRTALSLRTIEVAEFVKTKVFELLLGVVLPQHDERTPEVWLGKMAAAAKEKELDQRELVSLVKTQQKQYCATDDDLTDPEAAARALWVLLAEVPTSSSKLVDAASVLYAILHAKEVALDKKSKGESLPKQTLASHALGYAEMLESCGVEDASEWVGANYHSLPKTNEDTPPQRKGGTVTVNREQLSRFGATPAAAHSTLPRVSSYNSGTGNYSSTVLFESAGCDDVLTLSAILAELVDECLATGADAARNGTLNRLYDTIGQINLWLRRNGLAIQEALDPNLGKVVPQTTDAHTLYIPHTLSKELQWDKHQSVAYEQACLLYHRTMEQSRLERRLQELVQLSPEEFFIQANEEDLFEQLLEECDKCCLVGETRSKLHKRLTNGIVSRAKVHFHSGDVHIVAVPHVSTLKDFMHQLTEFHMDASTAQLYFLDETDKVVISSEAEFKDLLKSKRTLALEKSASSTLLANSRMNASSSVFQSAIISGNDLKLELFLDAVEKSQVLSPKRGGTKGTPKTKSPPPQTRYVPVVQPRQSERPGTELSSSGNSENSGSRGRYTWAREDAEGYKPQIQELTKGQSLPPPQKPEKDNSSLESYLRFMDRKAVQHGLAPKESEKPPVEQVYHVGMRRAAEDSHAPSSPPSPPKVQQTNTARPIPAHCAKSPNVPTSSDSPQNASRWSLPQSISDLKFAQHEGAQKDVQQEPQRNLFATVDDDDDLQDDGRRQKRVADVEAMFSDRTDAGRLARLQALRYNGPFKRTGVPLPPGGERRR